MKPLRLSVSLLGAALAACSSFSSDAGGNTSAQDAGNESSVSPDGGADVAQPPAGCDPAADPKDAPKCVVSDRRLA